MAMGEDLKQLHDKATRGLALAAEEHACLEAWYAQLDRDEISALAGKPQSQTVTALRHQVEAVTVRLLSVTQRIHDTGF